MTPVYMDPTRVSRIQELCDSKGDHQLGGASVALDMMGRPWC